VLLEKLYNKEKIMNVKMMSILLAAVGITGMAIADVKSIDGAGATFPYPVYAKWAAAYKTEKDVKINYQSIGSGGGIKQIKAGTVDFGASDAPLKAEELDKAGLMQFPMIMGGVVPVVNVPGVATGKLRLSNELLADIYLGKIKKWNDPRVQKENPGLKLPKKRIFVVHRADGSGTTWIFTNFLTKVSPDWKNKVGNGKSVAWPTGMGGKGNEGVASYVSRLKGAIGYVEYAYALQNNLNYVLLKNRSGSYVAPSSASFKAAAANADWKNSRGFYVVLTDQPGKESWPITGASFILLHKIQNKPARAKAVLNFFDWSYTNGSTMADELHYVAMPESVTEIVRESWKKNISNSDGKPIL
jgi:phosphate transport system substrate-binding protein